MYYVEGKNMTHVVTIYCTEGKIMTEVVKIYSIGRTLWKLFRDTW